MKPRKLLLLALFISACSLAKGNIPKTPTALSISLPPTWTRTPELPTRTPSLTATATQTPIPASTPIGGGGGLIAFISGREGSLNLFTVDINSREYTQYSFGDERVQSPFWSPDGKYFAFSKGVFTDNSYYLDQIFLADIQSHTAEQITSSDQNIGPSWSPEGDSIAFLSSRDGSWALYTMDLWGSHVTKHTNGLGFIDQPFWSPAGNHVILTDRINIAADTEIICIELGTYGYKNLTDNEFSDFDPAWSPNGEVIAFVSDRNTVTKIYLMNLDGSNQSRLTASSGWEYLPQWSPDGVLIAFQSYIDDNWDIYIINQDGSGLLRITDHPAPDISPVWSPDGSVLVFVSLRDDDQWEECVDTRQCNSEIYLFVLETGELVQLTENTRADVSPAWQPVLR